MRHFLIANIAALAAGSAAYAQDPAPKADPNAALPPTSRMDQATPTMKAPEGQPQTAPTGRVGEAVPAMKSADPQSAETGAKAAAFVADEQWSDAMFTAATAKISVRSLPLGRVAPQAKYTSTWAVFSGSAQRARA